MVLDGIGFWEMKSRHNVESVKIGNLKQTRRAHFGKCFFVVKLCRCHSERSEESPTHDLYSILTPDASSRQIGTQHDTLLKNYPLSPYAQYSLAPAQNR
jgi:hypothetical protein